MADVALDARAPMREFRIGRVLSHSFAVFSRNILGFTTVAAIVMIPTLLLGFFAGLYSEDAGAPPSTDQLILIGATIIVSFVLSPISWAIIIHASYQDMRGKPARLGDAVGQAFGRVLPLIGVGLLYSIGITLGAMLLLIPGIILMVMWFVSVPACVVEKTGAVRSLGRSRELTKGYRWKLFALGLVLVVISVAGNFVPQLGALVAGPLGMLGLTLITQAAIQAFFGVVIAIAYHDLRVAKEGVDIERIASVFD